MLRAGEGEQEGEHLSISTCVSLPLNPFLFKLGWFLISPALSLKFVMPTWKEARVELE